MNATVSPLNPVIRLICPSDSIAELTLLLRRAYKVLADMGFNYTATYQDEATTVRRIEGGECYVMADGAALIAPFIGTITLYRKSKDSACLEPWYARPEVASCAQFAVEPRLQRQGLGTKLMEFVEHRASELGATEPALDTSEGAKYLVRFYMGRGYRVVDTVRWEGKTYRSVILSKGL